MKFKLLLFILAKKLQHAAWRNSAFKKFIKDKKLRVNIKTADNSKGRHFVFDTGKIYSFPGVDKESDFSMIWSDAGVAFKTMASSNEEAPVAALTEQTLVIEGSFKEFEWFSRSLDIMMGKV